MTTPTRDEFSFGMLPSRRSDTFREGNNPFTGDVTRFYDSRATSDECSALEEVLERHDIDFDEDSLGYYGELGGTQICIPNVNFEDGYFGGASIELVGEVVSDDSLNAVLEMAHSANLFLEKSIGEGAIAVPTTEIQERVQAYRDEEVLLVDTVDKLRSWLVEHVGSRKVI